jgi:hypothetical protein
MPVRRRSVPDEELEPQSIDELRRKVGWQVSTAYGLELEEIDPEPVPVPVTVLPAEPEPEPEPEPELPPAAVVADPMAVPTLHELERLVAAAGAEHPERVEEWRWYLFYLRDFARPDGSLDPTFGLLIETAFSVLLPAS